MAAGRLTKEYREILKNAQALKRKPSSGSAAAAAVKDAAADKKVPSWWRANSKSAASPTLARTPSTGSGSSGATGSGTSVVEHDADDSDIILFPTDETRLFAWTAFITGPPDSPFEGGRFTLRIQVPSTYPHSPPTVHFVTRVFHPNVHWTKGTHASHRRPSAQSPPSRKAVAALCCC
jgi:hypothetical protein